MMSIFEIENRDFFPKLKKNQNLDFAIRSREVFGDHVRRKTLLHTTDPDPTPSQNNSFQSQSLLAVKNIEID